AERGRRAAYRAAARGNRATEAARDVAGGSFGGEREIGGGSQGERTQGDQDLAPPTDGRVRITSETEQLIGRLVAEAQPVPRLRRPAFRAGLWLASIAALAAAYILLFADLDMFARRAGQPKLALELVFTLFTGFLAVLAAFQLSLPDRSAAWVFLPLPTLTL